MEEDNELLGALLETLFPDEYGGQVIQLSSVSSSLLSLKLKGNIFFPVDVANNIATALQYGLVLWQPHTCDFRVMVRSGYQFMGTTLTESLPYPVQSTNTVPPNVYTGIYYTVINQNPPWGNFSNSNNKPTTAWPQTSGTYGGPWNVATVDPAFGDFYFPLAPFSTITNTTVSGQSAGYNYNSSNLLFDVGVYPSLSNSKFRVSAAAFRFYLADYAVYTGTGPSKKTLLSAFSIPSLVAMSDLNEPNVKLLGQKSKADDVKTMDGVVSILGPHISNKYCNIDGFYSEGLTSAYSGNLNGAQNTVLASLDTTQTTDTFGGSIATGVNGMSTSSQIHNVAWCRRNFAMMANPGIFNAAPGFFNESLNWFPDFGPNNMYAFMTYTCATRPVSGGTSNIQTPYIKNITGINPATTSNPWPAPNLYGPPYGYAGFMSAVGIAFFNYYPTGSGNWISWPGVPANQFSGGQTPGNGAEMDLWAYVDASNYSGLDGGNSKLTVVSTNQMSGSRLVVPPGTPYIVTTDNANGGATAGLSNCTWKMRNWYWDISALTLAQKTSICLYFTWYMPTYNIPYKPTKTVTTNAIVGSQPYHKLVPPSDLLYVGTFFSEYAAGGESYYQLVGRHHLVQPILLGAYDLNVMGPSRLFKWTNASTTSQESLVVDGDIIAEVNGAGSGINFASTETQQRYLSNANVIPSLGLLYNASPELKTCFRISEYDELKRRFKEKEGKTFDRMLRSLRCDRRVKDEMSVWL